VKMLTMIECEDDGGSSTDILNFSSLRMISNYIIAMVQSIPPNYQAFGFHGPEENRVVRLVMYLNQQGQELTSSQLSNANPPKVHFITGAWDHVSGGVVHHKFRFGSLSINPIKSPSDSCGL